MQYQSLVYHGQKIGRTIGFPTLNLDPKVLKNINHGVYQAEVYLHNQPYKGVLFLGPKKTFAEVETVLEIFLLDFSKEIYGEIVSFELKKYIRPPIKFASLDHLKKQLSRDVLAAWPQTNLD